MATLPAPTTLPTVPASPELVGTPVEEKHASGATTPAISPDGSTDELSSFTYTEAEERRVRWKLHFTVLLLLFIGFYVFQLERGNISNALTDDFLNRVGITQDQFNTGQALLFIGIILLEVPANYILHHVGPRIWISFQVLAFGLVATLQSMQYNYATFLTTRIALGIAECGYIPGSLYTLSTFYKRSELATVTAIFFLGSNLAGATTGLLAYGILPLGTRYPVLYGWQWLMIIEGSMAIFVALLIICFLPGTPANPRPLFLPIRYFSEREERILQHRVIADDKAKASTAKLTLRDIWGTLSNWRVWPHILMPIAYIAPTAAMSTYGPTLIRSFGFDSLTANALSSVSGWTLLIMTFVYGYVSDKTKIRGPLIVFALAISLVFWIAFQQKSTSSDRWLKYGLQVATQGLNSSFHPLNTAWLSLNCRTPQTRAVALAMVIMAANTGGLVGSQLLRGDDAPLYFRGFRVCVGLMAFALAVGAAQLLQYRWTNRRLDKRAQEADREAGPATSTEFRHTL